MSPSAELNKGKLFILIVVVLGVITSVLLLLTDDNQTRFANESITPSEEILETQPTTQTLPEESELTARPDLWASIPFTPQAPTANWDELHNEACEEASAIMIASYLRSINDDESVNIEPITKPTNNPPDKYFSLLDPEFVELEIAKLTNWQKDNFGYFLSIDTNETAKMISEVYNLNAKVVPFDIDTIKRTYLSGDSLIILPTDGRLLGNPYYKPPGPKYHMLVVSGYNPTEIITNDPGTKRGYNYKYKYDVIEKAVGNWNHDKQELDTSNKLMIIVSKKI